MGAASVARYCKYCTSYSTCYLEYDLTELHLPTIDLPPRRAYLYREFPLAVFRRLTHG